jgi:hypothetical protein
MGSLALRPGDSLAILVDGFVNRLQDAQFPSFLLFKLRGLDSYPGGTLTHCSCQPSLDAHISGLIPDRVYAQLPRSVLLGKCANEIGGFSIQATRYHPSRYAYKFIAPPHHTRSRGVLSYWQVFGGMSRAYSDERHTLP